MRATKRRTTMVLALVLAAAMLLSSAAFTGAQDFKVLRSAFLPGDIKLDPSLATDSNSIQILNETYVGLTALDEDNNLVSGIASEWSASNDGMVWTFKLYDNIPWVRFDLDSGEVVQVMDDAGNPRVVTAQDVVYGWQRTLDPNSASEYAYVLAAWVDGGTELLNAVDASADEIAALKAALGIVALDDFTVQVSAPITAGFAPMIYGLWLARPQLQDVVEQYGDAWTEPENYVSYGPYALEDWQHDVRVTIIKNPYWPGTGVNQAKIDEHDFVYLGDEPAMLASYEAGELDWLSTLPIGDLDRLRAERPDELNFAPRACTYYYGFNVMKPPVDNVHLRRALSMAIDRDAIVQILNAGQLPAGFFSRPGLAAAPLQEDFPDLAIWSDVEGAKAELMAYLEETGETLATMPSITIMHNTSQSHSIISQAVQQMWHDTLGIDVQISTMDFNVYQDTLQDSAPQVFRMGWCADYPDDHNFLYDVFRFPAITGVGLNYSNWENPEFQSLLDQAMVLTDNAERTQLYAQADGILVKGDAAIAPIYFYTFQQITAPYVMRTYSKSSNENLENWDIE